MKRILRHSRHWIRAKGRHGTHSPFVYAFVEQVLRAPGSVMPQQSFLSKKEITLLYKTIKYLKPEKIYAEESLLPVFQFINCNCITEPLPDSNALRNNERAVILLPCKEETISFLIPILKNENCAVLLIRPHVNKCNELTWQQLSASPDIKMSLDYWHFGLLINDPAFKFKQHFRLR